MATTVAQLTIEEFKGLIEEVIEQKLTEWLSDFDDRAEIRESVRDRLLQQKIATATGERGQPLAEVVQQLGFQS
ncbi:MAG: hypothetical protein DRR19_04530 [Candidatus Parabeggiatoa sp. nov. 1]|nr:MAG: hypothetical protein DRR19_04530 [Gammaproteobacteria bacterium]